MNTMSWGSVDMMDTMLAETGYSIPESELPQLADRIQHLETLVGGGGGNDFFDLLPDAIHSNPSDICKWIDSLIELTKGTSSTLVTADDDSTVGLPQPCHHVDVLAASESSQSEVIPSPQAPPQVMVDPCSSSSAKDGGSILTSSSSSCLPASVVHQSVDDEQEVASGIRLIHLLLACASCVEHPEQAQAAEAMVNEIRMLVMSMGNRAGAMGQVALYFARGLARRMSNHDMDQELEDPSFLEMLHLQFYHTCPYLKFGHFTANQAMLEELEGEKAVHIIDLELGLGLQWPPLIHMLAIRPGGAPFIRFTAVAGHEDQRLRFQVQQTGLRLAHLARTVNVELQFHMVEDLRSVQLRPGEAVAVNSMLQLHRFLYDASLITGVLAMIRQLNPKIFTVVEQDASHNSDNFQNRFVEALHFYSAMFDSIDASCKQDRQGQQQEEEEAVMASEAYLGREISNIIACEGGERVERHERLEQWKQKLYGMGFRPRHLGFNAYNQAATLLTIFPGGGHTIQETGGCLTLGWQSRPLVTASAWRC